MGVQAKGGEEEEEKKKKERKKETLLSSVRSKESFALMIRLAMML